jgi:adenylosuccinate lyase
MVFLEILKIGGKNIQPNNHHFFLPLWRRKGRQLMTDLHLLTAISPVDGRYRSKVDGLALYFSEYALIRYRVMVEVEYFIALCEEPLEQLKNFDHGKFDALRVIYRNFQLEDAERVKEIENVTNHDVKAVEYYLKEQFDRLDLKEFKEFIHFGLTSQDINNTAIPASLRDALHDIYYPFLEELIDKVEALSNEWRDVPMLARTHGQPASPTRLGKEIRVFVERLKRQLVLLKDIPCTAKFGGATGNFNAHKVAFPEVDWVDFANRFIGERFHLEREQVTTQISNYDNLAAIFDNFKRINTILIDLARDFWLYIMMEYFKQKIEKDEVGSSAMPHKVNPIDFENAEGNLGVANALFEHLSAKLPVSRLQRDLTDSTVLRNLGVPLAHSVLAIQSLQKGLGKLIINKSAIDSDLENNWAVVAEAMQTILRREGFANPYEILKDMTRTNETINKETISRFIDTLEVSDRVKDELKKISPRNYTGVDLF